MIYDIKKLKTKDYEVVIQEVVNFLSKYKIVKSIYQIGGVSAPGISDLDLVIILDDNAKEFTKIWHDYMSQQSENSKYIFTHYPLLFNKSIVESGEFLEIYPIFSLKHIFGEKYAITVKSNEFSDISNFLDLNLKFWAFEFRSKENSIRQSLLRLHSLKYPIQMYLRILNVDNNKYIEYIDKIVTLRVNCFNMKDVEEEINILYIEANKIAEEINYNINQYICKKLENYELDFKASINTTRFSATTNIDSTNYLPKYILINLLIYKNIVSKISKYYDYAITLENYHRDVIELSNFVFYKELLKQYEKKLIVFERYIPWIISNNLGWGCFTTPLSNTFVHYFSIDPNYKSNKLKAFLKLRTASARFKFNRIYKLFNRGF
jgi:hypothetical protein